MNNELENMWKEAVVAFFEVISQYLPGGGLRKTTTKSVMIAGLLAEIWTSRTRVVTTCPRRLVFRFYWSVITVSGYYSWYIISLVLLFVFSPLSWAPIVDVISLFSSYYWAIISYCSSVSFFYPWHCCDSNEEGCSSKHVFCYEGTQSR